MGEKTTEGEGMAIVIIGTVLVTVVALIGIFNEAFREWFAYFLFKIPVLF